MSLMSMILKKKILHILIVVCVVLVFCYQFNLITKGLTFIRYNSEGRCNDWKIIDSNSETFLVYSAFYESRYPDRKFVRVIGIKKKKIEDETIFCVAYFANNRKKTTHGELKYLNKENEFPYGTIYVTCPIPSKDVPIAISITLDVNKINHKLPVLNSRNYTEEQNYSNLKNFTVCVKSFHNHYKDAGKLLDFIEIYRILGVEHFTFYKHTITEDVECLLNYYIDKGIVELLPWQLDLTQEIFREFQFPPNLVFADGQDAAFHDCLYRNMYSYKYILMLDIDEIIMPTDSKFMLLHEMLDSFIRENDLMDTAGAFSFRNGFFCLEWEDDPEYSGAFLLNSQKKTKRLDYFHPHGERSKLIVNPRRVVEVGNHVTFELTPGFREVDVPKEVGYSHHYRICGKNETSGRRFVVDRTAWKYRPKLLTGVNTFYRNTRCGFKNEIYKSNLR